MAEIDWDAELWRIGAERMKKPLAFRAVGLVGHDAAARAAEITGIAPRMSGNVRDARRAVRGRTLRHVFERAGYTA